MVHRRREDARFDARDAMVTKVLYSLDGKQLFSLGIGVGRQWDSETWVGGDKFTSFGEYARPSQAILGRPKSGPYQLAEGSGNYPVELYTSKACDERGMKVASYAGKWDKLPDFDTLTPVKQGVLNITFPDAFVRSLTVGDMDSSRLMAGALLAQGKPEEAKALLGRLHGSGWPLSERAQWGVEQTRMRIPIPRGPEDADHRRRRIVQAFRLRHLSPALSVRSRFA